METPRTKRTQRRARLIGLLSLALLASACHRREKAGSTTTTSATEPAAKITVSPTARHAAAPLAEGPPPLLEPMLRLLPGDGLRGPASVIHDEESDFYLVSNVDGLPLASDGKGFISKVAPDGKKILTRWIEGGRNNVVLNAPKGMAIRDDELWVADIDTVRIFHRTTGLPMGEVKVPGSKFLDGVALAFDGRILVTDVGVRATGTNGGFEETGTDAVFAIYSDQHSTRINLVAKESLAGPTAVLPTPDKLWVVSSRTGELLSFDTRAKLDYIQKLPGGELEGLVALGDDLLVASRAASAILRGRPNGSWRIAIGDVKSPGNIAYDEKRGRVLVPLFTEDEVRIYNLR
jgi:hypothetical protein